MSSEPKCTRCGALAGTNDRPAVKGDPERCYWAAGQRSEAAYDNCARRAGERVAALEDQVARLKEERDAFEARLLLDKNALRLARAELATLRSAPPASVRAAAEAWLRWREEFGLPHSRETALMAAIREWLAALPAEAAAVEGETRTVQSGADGGPLLYLPRSRYEVGESVRIVRLLPAPAGETTGGESGGGR